VTYHLRGRVQDRHIPSDRHTSGRTVICEEIHCLFRCISEDTCFRVSRTDCIDCDPVFSIIQCSDACHSDNSEFGCGVKSLTTLRHESCDRSNIDEKSAFTFGFEDCFRTIFHSGKDAFAVQVKDFLIKLKS